MIKSIILKAQIGKEVMAARMTTIAIVRIGIATVGHMSGLIVEGKVRGIWKRKIENKGMHTGIADQTLLHLMSLRTDMTPLNLVTYLRMISPLVLVTVKSDAWHSNDGMFAFSLVDE